MKVAESPTFLESVANHPRVIRAIGCTADRFEVGDSWPGCIGLEWDTGGIVFFPEGAGVYSAHLVFLPKTRQVMEKCTDALRHVFGTAGAEAVRGTIPQGFRHVRRVAELAGMELVEVRDGFAHYWLTADDWNNRS